MKNIIKNARGSLTQTEFSQLLGTSQSLISKYESGVINPPALIIEACMAIIHDKNIDEDINLDELIQLMIKVLGGASQADRRKAFAVILSGFLAT